MKTKTRNVLYELFLKPKPDMGFVYKYPLFYAENELWFWFEYSRASRVGLSWYEVL